MSENSTVQFLDECRGMGELFAYATRAFETHPIMLRKRGVELSEEERLELREAVNNVSHQIACFRDMVDGIRDTHLERDPKPGESDPGDI